MPLIRLSTVGMAAKQTGDVESEGRRWAGWLQLAGRGPRCLGSKKGGTAAPIESEIINKDTPLMDGQSDRG